MFYAAKKRDEQVYAADLLKQPDGDLTIAFIGGSLTEGEIITDGTSVPESTNVWTNQVINYFHQEYPRKNIMAYNAGIGGTGSSYGAMRFREHIVKYAPDIVFIEFSVNDGGASKVNATVYLEAMIRMCMEMDKIPVIIYLHTPRPAEPGKDRFESWLEGVQFKNCLTAHYGIKTINIYDHLRDEYEADSMGLTFWEYLGEKGKNHYRINPNGESYDVHPNASGYEVYARAVIKALNEDREGCLSKLPFKETFNDPAHQVLHTEYTYRLHDDPSITYDGDWKIYTHDNPFLSRDRNSEIHLRHYKHPHFPDGLHHINQTEEAGFTFKTSAASFSLIHMTSYSVCPEIIAYLVNEDGSLGKMLDNLTFDFIFAGMNFPCKEVQLPNDGKEYTIRIVLRSANGAPYLFRFGYIAESAK